MIKRFFIVGVLTLSISASILCAHGLCESDEAKVIEKDPETAQVTNNYECPICKDEIDPAVKVMVEYKNKVYDLCCPACAKHFQKYPKKFSQKASRG